MLHAADIPRFTPKTAIITEEGEYMEHTPVRRVEAWAEFDQEMEEDKKSFFERFAVVLWWLAFLACAVGALVVGYKAAKAGEVFVGRPMSGTVAICDTLDEAMDIFNAAMDNYHAGLHMLRVLSNQKNADGAPRCGEYTGPLMFTNLLVSRTTTLPDGTIAPMHVAAVTIPAGNFFAVPIRVTFGEGVPVETST